MDSIKGILRNKKIIEPAEVTKLNKFISDEYGVKAEISIRGQSLIVGVNSSPLANNLRLRLPQIKRQLGIKQNIRLRIF